MINITSRHKISVQAVVTWVVLSAFTTFAVSAKRNCQDYKSMPEYKVLSRTDSLKQNIPQAYKIRISDWYTRSCSYSDFFDNGVCRTNFYSLILAITSEVSLHFYRKEFKYDDIINIILSNGIYGTAYSGHYIPNSVPYFEEQITGIYNSLAKIDSTKTTTPAHRNVQYLRLLPDNDNDSVRVTAYVSPIVAIGEARQIIVKCVVVIVGDDNIRHYSGANVNSIHYEYDFELPELFNDENDESDYYFETYEYDNTKYDPENDFTWPFYFSERNYFDMPPYAPFKLINISKKYFKQ